MSAASHFTFEFSTDSLKQLYDDYISVTSAVGIDRLNRNAFEKNLDNEIHLISRKILEGSYRFSQYKEKLISKGAGKYPRVISIPTFRDRTTLRALCNVLRKTYAEFLRAKLPQHIISEIRESLTTGKHRYFLNLDVSNFYPSIDHDVLEKSLRNKVRKTQIRKLIRAAIRTQTVAYPDKSKDEATKGVPQGLAISNILAEIYLYKFDQLIIDMPDVLYFRYVDDIFILSKRNPLNLYQTVKQELQDSYKLVVHDLNTEGKSKSGLISEKFNFLGYEFFHGLARIKKESIHRIESSLARIFTAYKYRCEAIARNPSPFDRKRDRLKAKRICAWRLNLRISGCLFDGVRRGWVFYFSQIDEQALEQLHELDNTVRSLALRFSFSSKELKSFVRTFHESKRSILNHRYIPDFDTSSVDQQRDILTMYGLDSVDKLTDTQIERAFKRRIRKETSELEQDIEGGSGN
jgi:RNA-directed DNA polymerase